MSDTDGRNSLSSSSDEDDTRGQLTFSKRNKRTLVDGSNSDESSNGTRRELKPNLRKRLRLTSSSEEETNRSSKESVDLEPSSGEVDYEDSESNSIETIGDEETTSDETSDSDTVDVRDFFLDEASEASADSSDPEDDNLNGFIVDDSENESSDGNYRENIG